MDHGSDPISIGAAVILVVGGAIFTILALRSRSVATERAAIAVARPGHRHDVPAGSAPRSRQSMVGGSPRIDPAGGASLRRSLVLVLAGLSAGAAVIHLAAAPAHFAEIGALAVGFVVSAAFQALWACWCLGDPSRRTLAIGIAGNLAIVGAWAWTRTVGLPVGEFAGSPEPIGYPDAASVVFEVLLIGGVAARWLDLDLRAARRPLLTTVASIAVVPAVGLVLVLTSLATLAIAAGVDHGSMPVHMAMDHLALP